MLDDCNRTQEGKEYLNEVFSEYVKLNENGFLLDKKIKDQLLDLPKKLMLYIPSPKSTNSSLGNNTDSDVESNSSKV